MSSSHLQDAKAQHPTPGVAQVSQPQFAQGGNSIYSEAPPEPAVNSANRQSQASDALVMLQLASFEGRAF